MAAVARQVAQCIEGDVLTAVDEEAMRPEGVDSRLPPIESHFPSNRYVINCVTTS